MLRQILLCLAVSLLAACANHAPEAPGAFGRADSNNDRKVSLNEWQLVGGKDAAFLAADPERRGSLTESQFYEAQRLNESVQQNNEAQRTAVDSQITQSVRNALAADRDLSGWAIRVETYQGNVQLSGSVRSDKEKMRAQDIASGISGVKQVFNSITIKY